MRLSHLAVLSVRWQCATCACSAFQPMPHPQMLILRLQRLQKLQLGLTRPLDPGKHRTFRWLFRSSSPVLQVRMPERSKARNR